MEKCSYKIGTSKRFSVRKRIYEDLKSIRCPIHGQAPTITVKGILLIILNFKSMDAVRK